MVVNVVRFYISTCNDLFLMHMCNVYTRMHSPTHTHTHAHILYIHTHTHSRIQGHHNPRPLVGERQNSPCRQQEWPHRRPNRYQGECGWPCQIARREVHRDQCQGGHQREVDLWHTCWRNLWEDGGNHGDKSKLCTPRVTCEECGFTKAT